ncbi:DEAD-like helicase [Apiospora kogelbergensis]|uniref:DEAD-like helicase n=1 Tax=Apiospora kogelbergensis TaxID=1337665 RepID=UPI00312F02B4
MLAVTDRNGEQSEVDELKSSLKKVKGVVVRMKELSFKGVTAEEDRNLICNYMNHLAGLLEHKAVSSSAKMAIRRMLSLSSFDGHIPEMLCVDDNVSSFMDPAALREQVSAGEGDSGPVSEAAPSTLGAEQAELLRRGDPDGGLLYMYYTFEYSKCRIAAPLKRSSMVQWHLGRSPVMTEIAKEVAENMKSKKRTLVVVNDPFCQQEVVALIEMIGWEVGCIRASDSMEDREQAVKQFNSTDSPMAAFVLNASLDTTKLNFHGSCSRGIIAQYPKTMKTMIQIMGRLVGEVQKEEVIWTILRVNGSYYDIQEDKMCKKFAEILQKETKTPEYLEIPILRRIVAYEQIRVLLSQPFNRYSWCAPGIYHPVSIQEYNDVRYRRLGKFYITMAQFEAMDDDHQCYKEPTIEWLKGALPNSEDDGGETEEVGSIALKPKKDVRPQKMGDRQEFESKRVEMMMDSRNLVGLGKTLLFLPDPARSLGPRNITDRKG